MTTSMMVHVANKMWDRQDPVSIPENPYQVLPESDNTWLALSMDHPMLYMVAQFSSQYSNLAETPTLPPRRLVQMGGQT